MLTIEFTTSLSAKHSYAVREALGRHARIVSRDTYSLDYLPHEAKDLDRMLTYLQWLRRRRVFSDGQELPWHEVFAYVPCWRMRRKDPSPESFCCGLPCASPARNPWRCIRANMPLAYGGSLWLHFGRFDLDGTFLFDKQRMKHELLSNLHPYRFCPVLSIDNALKILEAFPETANPRIDPRWKPAEPYSEALSVSIALGPQEKYFTGVRPASPRSVERIIEQIQEKLSPV